MSLYGKAVLGFCVSRQDFLKPRVGSLLCAQGHPQRDQDQFCSRDGTQFLNRGEEEAQPALKALYVAAGIEWIEEDFNPASTYWQRLWRYGDGPIFEFDLDEQGPTLVVGVQLLDLVDYRQPLTGFVRYDTGLQGALATVQQMRAAVVGATPHVEAEERVISLFFGIREG